MINRQDSRHRIKRSNLTGVVPTAHTASTDFTDGTWLNTDLREAEFFYNIPDKKLWIGTGTSSIEIAQIGSTSSGNSLEQTLAIGNNSGAQSIIMGSFSNIHSSFGESYIDVNFNNQGSILLSNATDGGDPLNNASAYIIVASNIGTYTSDGILIGSDTGNIKIQTSSALNLVTTNGINLQSDTYIYSGYALKSNNGGGQIDLDYFGSPGEVSISTDNGNQAESYLYMTPITSTLVGGDGSRIDLTSDAYIKASPAGRVLARAGNTGLKIDGRYNIFSSEDIFRFINNATQSFTTQDSIKPSVSIASQNSTINAGVTSSVILGGSGITATQSNTVYVPDLYIQDTKSISFNNNTTFKNTNAGLLNIFDIKSSVTTATASIQLTTGLSTTIVSTVQGTSSATTQEISENGGLKMSHTNGTDSGLTYQKIGAVSTTTIGTFSMASITFMSDDQSFSIRGQANGYCASPNRNMGATFYASFLKYGGTIYQNGTTDIVLKDGYGDGTTPAVWTDGTNIYISVRTFSALTSTFTTSYEILV